MLTVFELNELLKELEKLATYKNEDITEEQFTAFLKNLKNDLPKFGYDYPEFFKNIRTKDDFRVKMQNEGGYATRREKLKQIMYPIVDLYENESLVKDVKITQAEINEYIKSNDLETKYGKIKNISLDAKSGGNAVVYFGELNKTDVAVKFLLNVTDEKKNRFLCEYINVVMKLDNLDGIVKQFFHDEVIINRKKVSIIVMKKYVKNLAYQENISEAKIIELFKQLLSCIKKFHDVGIIHRDLKPQNILLDEKGFINIADFGIAYYNPLEFDLTGHTETNERLANFDFSAPEQRDSKEEPKKSMDIYALGQIIHWLVFGKTHKGTHRETINSRIDSGRMELLDDIVDKCLNNNPIDRYQSIDEIFNEIKKFNDEKIQKKSESIIENDDLNFEDIKNKINDIMENICSKTYDSGEWDEETVKTFVTYNLFSDDQVLEFLESIDEKLKELDFFDSVYITDFVDQKIDDEIKISKEYFKELSNVYKNIIKKNNIHYKSFIKFVKTKLNNNFVQLPF